MSLVEKTTTLSKYEYEVFKRYKNGEILLEEHMGFVKDYALIGLFRLGCAEIDNDLKSIAALTPLGKSILYRERIYRNPISNFFYTLFSLSE